MRLARFLCSICAATLTTAACIAYSQANVVENESAVLYVDAQSGLDTNPGSAASPLKTIQAAINKANTNNQKSIGTKIVVDAGVYRETVNIDSFTGQTAVPLTLEAATTGSAIISASDVLNGWSPDPQFSGAYVTNWTPAESTCPLPSAWPTVQEIALHTEMVFVNGIAMTQVLASSDLKRGTFFVNTADSTLHVFPPSGVDPSNATIEAASRAKTLSVFGRTNVVLRGLVFEHAASCVNTSGATVSGSNNVLIDSIQANWNNWGGLGVASSTNVTVQNSVASYNGGVGFQGTKDQTSLYTNNETDYNNWRGAQAAFYNWAMGGIKLFQMRTTTVQDHFSYNNQAQGLWLDTDNQNMTINHATLAGSYNAALQLERNEGPITLENSYLCSSGVGLNVLTTEGLTVSDNVFYDNGATNKYQAQFYLAGTPGGISITNWQTGQVYDLVTSGTVLSGNSFIDSTSGQFVFGTYLSGSDWTDFTSTLKSGANTWFDPTTTTAFRIVNGKNVDLAGWQSATGADYNSVWAGPAASPASECTPPPASYPDFNVSLDNASYAMSSGIAIATVRVNSFNFGTVNLSVSGLPAGVTAAFSTPNLISGFSELTFTASSTSASQTVPVTLWAISGDRVHSATFNLTLSPDPGVIATTTSLAAAALNITQNSPITFTATVAPASGSVAPTGTVSFYSGGAVLGTATLSAAVAGFTTSALPAGINSITAEYNGTGTFSGSSSSAVTVTVNAAVAATTTILSTSAPSIAQGSAVMLTAAVKASNASSSPTGAVTFYNGSAVIGSVSLSSGVATISISNLPVGSDAITAIYSGSGVFSSSTSNMLPIEVNAIAATTTTSLAASATTVTQGSPLTLAASVKQSTSTITPTGTVSFYSGSTLLGSAALSSGTASITASALPAGTDSISAAYSGAVAFKASSSGIVTIIVNPAASAALNTTTVLASSATSIPQNSPITFLATVKPATGETTPTGTVTFLDHTTTLGTATLSGGIASVSTSALSEGQHVISAVYAGGSAFLRSTSNSVNVSVVPKAASSLVGTSTAVAASASQADQGYTICLTASVSPASGTSSPTGQVVFSIGTRTIGSASLVNGKAYFTTSTLPVGDDVITAGYSGDNIFAPSASPAISVAISGPDFTVEATPSAVFTTPGGSANLALLITPKNGFNQDPKMSCSGLPAGATCLFGAPAKQPDGTSRVSMAIQTKPENADARVPRSSQKLSRAPFTLALLPLVLCFSSRRRKEFARLTWYSVLALASILGGSAIGCGGKAGTGSTASPSSSNTVRITVTAQTAAGLSHTTDVQLTLM